MQYIVKTQDFILTDKQKQLAQKLGISQEFLRLLLGRGMEEESLYDFLHPSLDNLSSPYDIDGMGEAVARIRRAIAEKEKVLIYGDYDCDGICAISTLMLFLKDKLDVFYFIPDRNKDGYGISVEALERVLYKQSPTLVITVDCGITAVDEVEYLKSRGIDVIVTDHHEPQERIPDCIVLDPKVERRGFYDLCGAGVAFKLVEALSSRQEASKYLDVVSIATIADVVPLKEDNRIIAYYGLKQISTSPRKGVKMLMGSDKVSAQDIMFRLAPRMNAAGRLNSAMKVVGLFLETDYFLLKSLTEELERDNAARQSLCEKAVNEAKNMLKGADFSNTGLITLYSENWEAGILGIACARLVEEFKRPVVLFAQNGEDLKGSARSVPSINIFEFFCNLSTYFTAFGGHSQAAGVSMKTQNFERFKQDANRLVLSSHSLDEFEENITCEMQLPMNTDFLKFAKELELLEPTGYQNPQPSFLIDGENIRFDRIGFSQHVKYSSKNLDLLGFSKFTSCLYPRTGRVKFDVTLGTNVFQNNVTAQGIIRNIVFENVSLAKDESDVLNLHHLHYEGTFNLQSLTKEQLECYLKDKFGTLIVCFCKEEYDALCGQSEIFAKLPLMLSSSRCLNPENGIIVCPCEDFDFSFYKRVVFAGKPLCDGYLAHVADRVDECFLYGDCATEKMKVSDDVLRCVYKEIVNLCSRTNKMSSPNRMYAALCSRYKVSESVFYLALDIFEQLKLVSISEKGIITISKKAVRLTDSISYRNLAH